MSDFKPGDVCVATVRGVEDVRVMRERDAWITSRRINGAVWHPDDSVTDVRPLVVLDLEERRLITVASILRENAAPSALLAADQIEAQTKPARIPEPGLWGVVEAGVKQHDERIQWLNLGGHYRPNDSDEYDRLWDDLIDPVLVRPGIEEGS